MRTFLGLLFFVSTSHAAVPTSWKEISAPGVEKMWKSEEVKNAYVSILKEGSTYNLDEFDAKFYVSTVPEIREFMHNLLGFKNYKIEKSHSERTTDSWIVKLEGSYVKKGGLDMNFCEVHTFTSSGFTQKQLFFPTSSNASVLASQGCFDVINKVTQ